MAKMLCELAVGLSSLLLLPLLAVAAFFFVKSQMRPKDAVAGALHRPQWEKDVVYLVQFPTAPHCRQGCQRAKFDPFLSLDCARVEGVGAQSKERKGSNSAA